jgi:tRNA U55 pseudouridine synthase TruB|tara:strand:+ start:345 stop:1130 length:786 start_codon:yes stop_codon:yes gene_type:complete
MKILYKQECEMIYHFMKRLKQEGLLQEKCCYCGRLDPMAKGKMLFLEGEERKKMEHYLQCDKEYEFEIGLGISTDTDDILGMIEEVNLDTINLFDYSNVLQTYINIIISKHTQKYHKFSAFQIKKNGSRVNLCELSKQNKLNPSDIPSKECSVHYIQKLNKKIIDSKYFVSNIKKKLKSFNDPKNYYRTKEIIKGWETFGQTLSNNIHNSHNFITYKYKIKVSSGFYIRQFIADLKKMCNFPLIVLNINRTNIFINNEMLV